MLFYFVLGCLLSPALGQTTAVPISNMIQTMFQRGDTNQDGIYSRAEAWAQALKLDTDGDNKLSQAEYVKSWSAVNPALASVGAKIFNNFDYDKNGFITEYDAGVSYAVVDMNGNGEVSADEFGAYMRQILNGIQSGLQPKGFNVTAIIDARFPVIDANNDGSISYQEMLEDVLQLDANKDGRVDKIEFLQTMWNSSDPNSEIWTLIFEILDYDVNAFVDNFEIYRLFQIMDSEVSRDDSVTRAELDSAFRYPPGLMGNRTTSIPVDYGFIDGDTDNDGRLTVEEEWANILRSDTDNDNRISKTEFMAMFQPFSYFVKNAAGNIFQSLDLNSDGYLEREDVAGFYNQIDTNNVANRGVNIHREMLSLGMPTNDYGFILMDSNRDGALSLDELWAAFLSRDMTGDGLINREEYITNAGPMFAEVAPRLFDGLDANNNSVIEQSDIAAVFGVIDDNNDNLISPTEFSSSLQEFFASVGLNISVSVPISGIGMTTDFGFSASDTNRDGRLTLDEQWAAFVRLDRSGDNMISLTEYQAATPSVPDNIRALIPQLFQNIDRNNNSFIERSDVSEIFNNMDTNGDKSISPSEFETSVEAIFANLGIEVNVTVYNKESSRLPDFGFSLVDTNHDGFISFDEQWASLLEIDENGDNRISLGEYSISYEDASPGIQAAIPKIFDHFDVNKDGFYDKSEVYQSFEVVDKDGDGLITQPQMMTNIEELFANYSVVLNVTTQRAPSARDLTFSNPVTGDDGFANLHALLAAFVQPDTKGNSPVGLREFADVDNQGLIKEILQKIMNEADAVKKFKTLDVEETRQ